MNQTSCQKHLPIKITIKNSSWGIGLSGKLWWCRARDLFESQILVATGGFELQISCIKSSYLTHSALRPKYSQKPLDHAKQSARDALKTDSKRVIQKTAEETGNLIGNKIVDKITKSQKLHNKKIQKQLQMSMIKNIERKIYIFRRKTEDYW